VGIACLSGLRNRSQEGARWAWVNLGVSVDWLSLWERESSSSSGSRSGMGDSDALSRTSSRYKRHPGQDCKE
jgi:hypothetical protein